MNQEPQNRIAKAIRVIEKDAHREAIGTVKKTMIREIGRLMHSPGKKDFDALRDLRRFVTKL